MTEMTASVSNWKKSASNDDVKTLLTGFDEGTNALSKSPIDAMQSRFMGLYFQGFTDGAWINN